ncbi:MAG TPA: flagellar filament capping protein FliD [Burkholderiaceae bacterium]|nr:flagellar filament capping protein FliD [Burkholderiaceae bacterium]
MTTSISTTGSISSAGIGSGLDVNSIIAGLMKVEQAPLTKLQSQATTIQTTISAFGAVQSAMAAFRDASSALALPSTWNATSATSADPTAVTVASSANASTGSYAVSVQKLAASQSTVSPTFGSGDALVGAGTLHFDLGNWASDPSTPNVLTAFTAKSGSTGINVAITATDTLATLASKVNSAGAGVTASVVNDASGSRLVFSSTTTGTDNGFRITTGDAGLAALAFDPAGGTSGTTLTQPASNAAATVNGLAVNSATNSLVNVFNGLTITLNKVTSAPVQIGVAQDSAAIKASVKSFVDAYNSLSTLLGTDLKYDSATKVAGPLQADSAATSLQRQLRNLVGSASAASSTFTTLSQVGLEIQTDGTLKINDTKLGSAMANPAELKKLFTHIDPTDPSNNGFATRLRTLGNSVLGGDGLLSARVAGLTAKLTRNQKDQNTLNDRLASTQARLQAQYSALDTKMAGINTLSTYVTQQIANWNKNTR